MDSLRTIRAPRRATLALGIVCCGALTLAACTTELETLAILPGVDAGHADPPDAGDSDAGAPDASAPPGAIWTEWVPPKPAFTPIVRPSPRSLATMAYDTFHSVSVLFGGCSVADCQNVEDMLDDTWEWTGEKWIAESPETVPYPRIFTAMAFDAEVGNQSPPQVVLFGGFGCSNLACSMLPAPRDDTWTWNSRTWTPLPVTASPPPRSGHALVYDPLRDEVVLFGGQGAEKAPLNDTWVLKGNTWTEVTPPAPSPNPPARTGHAMTYDAARGVTVLFGGYACADKNCSGALVVADDTWTWDGTAWTQVTTATAPPARALHTLVYDTKDEVSILFGGADAAFDNLNDTWEWNGSAWIQLFPVEFPPLRSQQAMTYDTTRNVTVLFGGLDTLVENENTVWGDLWTLSVFP